MHYRSEVHNFGFDVIGTVEQFLELCDNVVHYESNSFEVTKDTPAQVAVPAFKNPSV